jgi:hypothetical protein
LIDGPQCLSLGWGFFLLKFLLTIHYIRDHIIPT